MLRSGGCYVFSSCLGRGVFHKFLRSLIFRRGHLTCVLIMVVLFFLTQILTCTGLTEYPPRFRGDSRSGVAKEREFSVSALVPPTCGSERYLPRHTPLTIDATRFGGRN